MNKDVQGTPGTFATPKRGTIEMRAECAHCGSIVWSPGGPSSVKNWLHEGNNSVACPRKDTA